MGDSLVRTNGQLLKDLGADMLLITYADIVFTETTLRVVRSVGWTLKEVCGVASSLAIARSLHLALSSDDSNLQLQSPPSSLRPSLEVRTSGALAGALTTFHNAAPRPLQCAT